MADSTKVAFDSKRRAVVPRIRRTPFKNTHMESLTAISRGTEDYTARKLQPLQAHLSAIGGFLVVSSFIDNGSEGVTHRGDHV
ncbi:hypothetical protein B0H19DRAFT_107828 [Mycena capillaripes]|nr:hypothetical protein B0H19DRAFT_107828 [Mycena capillaripes]